MRSAGKSKAGRQASKSPYARPKQGASAGSSSQSQPIPPPQSVTAGLQSAMDAMLIGPVSARTRLRQQFLKRPAQSALANALIPPPQGPAGSKSLRPGLNGAGTNLRLARSQPTRPQPRLVAPLDPSTHASTTTSTSTQGAAVLPPREALAEARRKKSSSSSSNANAAVSRKGVAPKTTTAAAAAAYAANYPQTSSLAGTRASMRLADGRATDEGARTVRMQVA